ncbi:MAG: succinylglutamate desuccinylase/aspartoacylase family protein [Bdellovibrio sp.]|nr:succinylglutamate desuccinylase/aspartoacylase family protein [Bdellovibrio sp.]
MNLRILNHLPVDFFTCTPTNLSRLFPNGTLICLEGKRKNPLFLSCLLHGNETSSFYAVLNFLKNTKPLPRSLVLFFGNVTAASKGLRQLPNGPDFNRIWAGGKTPEEQMAAEVINFAKSNHVWASIDMHNNTGDNPYYACINKRDRATVALASLFSDKILFFEKPHQAQSIAFSQFCTSVTLECGKSGDQIGVGLLTRYLEKVLSLDSLEQVALRDDKLSPFQTVGRILLPQGLEIDFNFSDSSTSDLSFPPELEQFNFERVKKGTIFAKLPRALGHQCYLQVVDNLGQNVTPKYFCQKQNNLVVTEDFTPAMLTKDIRVAKDDCLAYLIENLS